MRQIHKGEIPEWFINLDLKTALEINWLWFGPMHFCVFVVYVVGMGSMRLFENSNLLRVFRASKLSKLRVRTLSEPRAQLVSCGSL